MIYEIEGTEGLIEMTEQELRHLMPELNVYKRTSDSIQIESGRSIDALLTSRTANAVYSLQHFDVPRPKALLGHQNFHLLLEQIRQAFTMSGRASFQTLHLNAAGSGSSVMRRIKTELATHTGLIVDEEAGDLLLRIRRVKTGWETLVRLTPRPLVTRDWRVADMEGALNASVAAMMNLLTAPGKDGVFVNLMCGSGTLMIERALLGGTGQIIGCELDSTTLDLASKNIAAANLTYEMQLLQADVTRLPFDDQTVDVLCADLPFGQLIGSHGENRTLYPATLKEAARLARPHAMLILITHEIRLMETVLMNQYDWVIQETHKITLRGLHPRIYLLRKRS
jgi:tRNA (guanine6-N2)-methyltransferase